MATISTPGLADHQLAELLALIKGADTVELKLTVPVSDRSGAGSALGVDPLDGEIRQVYFFDTPDLALNSAGLVVRARRVQGRGDDSVVKLRPVVPDEVPAKLREDPDLVIEVDAMPGGYVCSASYKRRLKEPRVRETLAAGGPIRRLFSKRQRAFFADHAPEGIELDDLTPLGPVNVLKLKFKPEDYARRMVAELWLYPDFSRILELSTKCLPGEGMRTAAETRLFLRGRGVDLSGEQQT